VQLLLNALPVANPEKNAFKWLSQTMHLVIAKRLGL
jgi:hypothetical protein